MNLIERIDEEFASSPVDGVCVLSIKDWQILKAAVSAQTAHNKLQSEILERAFRDGYLTGRTSVPVDLAWQEWQRRVHV